MTNEEVIFQSILNNPDESIERFALVKSQNPGYKVEYRAGATPGIMMSGCRYAKGDGKWYHFLLTEATNE